MTIRTILVINRVTKTCFSRATVHRVKFDLAFLTLGYHFKSLTALAYIVVNYFNGCTIHPRSIICHFFLC